MKERREGTKEIKDKWKQMKRIIGGENEMKIRWKNNRNENNDEIKGDTLKWCINNRKWK
jgi:hypothetical protein